MSLLDRIVVVLYEPQDPVNIAATAASDEEHGRLRTAVDPSCGLRGGTIRVRRAWHGRSDRGRRHEADLDAAIADCVDVIAFTARRRAAKRTVLTPPRGGRAIDSTRRPRAIRSLCYSGGRTPAYQTRPLTDRERSARFPTSGARVAQSGAGRRHCALRAAPRCGGRHPGARAHRATTSRPPARSSSSSSSPMPPVRWPRSTSSGRGTRSTSCGRLRSLTSRAAPDGREITLLRAMALEVLRTLDRLGIIPRDRLTL